MDDDASIQILEPDADQQYVPERKERDRQRATKPVQKVADVNWQKPPVLIVERQVAASPQQSTASVPTVSPAQEELPAARIVNIVEEKPTVWNNRISDIVWAIIRFFIMAFISFFALVLLNPPFIQETQQPAIFGESIVNGAMQRKPASLSRAAAWATGASVAYIILPPIWDLLSNKVVSEDLLKAFGLK